MCGPVFSDLTFLWTGGLERRWANGCPLQFLVFLPENFFLPLEIAFLLYLSQPTLASFFFSAAAGLDLPFGSLFLLAISSPPAPGPSLGSLYSGKKANSPQLLTFAFLRDVCTRLIRSRNCSNGNFFPPIDAPFPFLFSFRESITILTTPPRECHLLQDPPPEVGKLVRAPLFFKLVFFFFPTNYRPPPRLGLSHAVLIEVHHGSLSFFPAEFYSFPPGQIRPSLRKPP